MCTRKNATRRMPHAVPADTQAAGKRRYHTHLRADIYSQATSACISLVPGGTDSSSHVSR